jgi:hypothetical protein
VAAGGAVSIAVTLQLNRILLQLIKSCGVPKFCWPRNTGRACTRGLNFLEAYNRNNLEAVFQRIFPSSSGESFASLIVLSLIV